MIDLAWPVGVRKVSLAANETRTPDPGVAAPEPVPQGRKGFDMGYKV